MVFATLAFLGAFGADQGLLTYFADVSGPGLPYLFESVLLQEKFPSNTSCNDLRELLLLI